MCLKTSLRFPVQPAFKHEDVGGMKSPLSEHHHCFVCTLPLLYLNGSHFGLPCLTGGRWDRWISFHLLYTLEDARVGIG
ncbi:hypothetical protein JTE90_025849 [Oedothorax gibbosus]|uniref:Uncharacterized protein n=1 Tax=Oedothorax gibbosus TaxID=931172 RepID=A0AAV6UM18_9ARAC|nr:hypothetical protein JTE90_025849 [Oedothorax gibbosus]